MENMSATNKTMKYKNIFAAVAGSALAVAMAVPAFAQQLGANANVGIDVNTSSGTVRTELHTRLEGGASSTVRAEIETRTAERGDQEIERRITALNTMMNRINAMVRLSSEEKANLAASVQNQITEMTNIRSRIQADVQANATSSLRDDVKSITGSYRTFALVMPQSAIAAMADRAETLISMYQTFGTKLQARISAVQASGTNITAMQSAYADFTAKIADAQTKAQAAVSKTSSLTPDNGDQAKFQANQTVLKDARAKLQAAQQDLVAARKDAGAIVKALMSLKVSAGASASTTATGGSQ